MRAITIVGMGMNLHTVTAEGLAAIHSAQALFGAPRLLSLVSHLSIPAYSGYTLERMQTVMDQHNLTAAVLLVSGDTGFYSAARSIQNAPQDCKVTFIPGISSLCYFFAKLGMAWQDVKLLSCHGKEANFVDAIRRNRQTFLLTGRNRHHIAAQLTTYGFGDLAVFVGENLGSDTEKVYKSTVTSLDESPALTVLLIENPHFDPCIRYGIPDDRFVRGSAPMTKAEVRGVTMSKLKPKPSDICYDLGCGTGSVTVELALAAYEGQVFSIDKSEDATALTKENCRKFQLGNAAVICGCVPDVLHALPPADVVFIGGSCGNMDGIVQAVLAKNPKARLVVNAVSLETLTDAAGVFDSHGLEAEIVQISVAKAKKLGSHHLMMGQNPVYVISGGGDES